MRTPTLNTAAPTTVGVTFNTAPQATTMPSEAADTLQVVADDAREKNYLVDNRLGETKVTIGQSDEEREEYTYNISMYHRETPIRQGTMALESIGEKLEQLDQFIAKSQPQLIGRAWDVTVKNGRLEVVAEGVSKRDKAWLEAELNGDQEFVSAVSGFMKAVVGYLETTDDNPAYHGINYATGAVQAYDFSDVDGQLEGVLGFKNLIAAVKDIYKSPDGSSATGYSYGYTALEIIASGLVANKS
jgi:hypothetical protein